jgi:phenylacetate-CoA ligase
MLRESRILEPALEQESEEARRARLSRRLRETVGMAWRQAPRVRELVRDDIRSLEDLDKIPITRKDELGAIQALDLPFGGLLSAPVSSLQRIFLSPGPIYDPEGPVQDFWRFRMAFAAAGLRAGDRVQNTLSYHLSPGGWMLDAGLRALGCVVVPAGVGQTELQVRVAHDLGVTGYTGTPSFLHTLLTKAREGKTPLRIESAFATAEMLPESLRSELENDFGIRVLQGYATADVGCLAYECPEKGGMHLQPECIVEVLDLESGKEAATGQPGEVVATVFDEAYPLLRLATGDLSAFKPAAPCACGRTARKLTGLLGRVGDALKVKGLFIRGSQLDPVFKAYPEVARWQAVITRQGHHDQLAYIIELGAPADEPALCARLAEALRESVKVRGEVRVAPPGTLAKDAKRIRDERTWK